MARASRRSRKKKSGASSPALPTESRAAEAVTIAWTSSVTATVMADLVVIAAHLYSRANPDAQSAHALEAIMLICAAAMGAVSLALLLVAWRARVVKPPQGYMVFAGLIAAAPILALIARLAS